MKESEGDGGDSVKFLQLIEQNEYLSVTIVESLDI